MLLVSAGKYTPITNTKRQAREYKSFRCGFLLLPALFYCVFVCLVLFWCILLARARHSVYIYCCSRYSLYFLFRTHNIATALGHFWAVTLWATHQPQARLMFQPMVNTSSICDKQRWKEKGIFYFVHLHNAECWRLTIWTMQIGCPQYTMWNDNNDLIFLIVSFTHNLLSMLGCVHPH